MNYHWTRCSENATLCTSKAYKKKNKIQENEQMEIETTNKVLELFHYKKNQKHIISVDSDNNYV